MFWGFPWVFLVAQSVKNLPAVQETLLQYLGWEDLLEKEMANPLQYPCLENLMEEEPGGLQTMRPQKVGHD